MDTELRLLPTPAREAEQASIKVLTDAIERVQSGETISVLVVEEKADSFLHTYSPSLDRIRRIGLLTVLLSVIVGPTD